MNVKSKFYVVFLTYTIIINQLVGGGCPEISLLGLHRGEGDVLEYITEDVARFYPLPRAI